MSLVSEMKINVKELLKVISKLESEKIFYRLSADISELGDAVCLQAFVLGEHWEIDFLDNGTVDVEIFKSNGEIYGREKIDELFKKHSD